MRVQSQFIEMFGNSIHTKKLIEVCNIEKGSTITKEQTSNGDIPVVAGGLEPSCYHNVANRPAGMITVSASGANAGYVNYWEVPIFASDCNTIYPIELEKVSPIFMYWQLKVIQKQIYKLQKGGAQPHVYGKDLADMQIVQPPMEFQLRYVKIAEQADKSKFGGFKSQFIEMFDDIEKKPFVDVCISKGEYGSNSPADDYDGNIRYVRITDITEEGNLNGIMVSPRKVEEKYMLLQDDLLFARTGNTVGKTYLHKSGRMIFAGYLIRYRLNKKCMLPQFAFAYTHTNQYYDWVEKIKKVGAQPNISAAQYDSMPIPVPSMAKQIEFVAIARQADKSKYYN